MLRRRRKTTSGAELSHLRCFALMARLALRNVVVQGTERVQRINCMLFVGTYYYIKTMTQFFLWKITNLAVFSRVREKASTIHFCCHTKAVLLSIEFFGIRDGGFQLQVFIS